MRQYPNAADGLRLMLYGELLTIVGVIFGWVPLVGAVVLLAGGVVSLYGLSKAGADDEGYRTAFLLTIVNVVASVVGSFCKDGSILGSLLDIVSKILALAVVYFVCTTTANLLHTLGEDALAGRGRTVWTINLVCTVVGVALNVLLWIPVLNILAAVAVVVMAVVELVGYILYLLFLNGSYKIL